MHKLLDTESAWAAALPGGLQQCKIFRMCPFLFAQAGVELWLSRLWLGGTYWEGRQWRRSLLRM